MREFRPKPLEGRLVDALKAQLSLSDETIGRLLSYGAVTLRFRGKGAWQRVRDGGVKLSPSDQILVSYEPKVLALPAYVAEAPLWESKHYGVWYKPAGVMSQGTAAGDHCSLLYAVEQLGKEPFLVHRLDRETEGIMLVAYDSRGAAALSLLFQQQKVHKTYLAIACGKLASSGLIDQPLDGKPAQTRYEVLKELPEQRLLVKLEPLTGRLHQIRRHLAHVHAGVWGDPKYGKGNKNREGLKLAAVALKFQDPFTLEERSFEGKASFV